MVQSWIKLLAVGFLLLTPAGSVAQNSASPPAAPSQQLLKPEELDALVAPIALYPDTLLALVFMASTYPLEVVQADRWTKQNSGLKGDQLKAAVDKQSWDESVRSLVATPSVLEMMSTKLDWTQRLGDAVLAQQADVMDAVQRLRSRAQANKQLSSNKQQTVSVSTAKSSQGQPRQVISIEPTEPSTIYVPHYNPSVVYGGWPYPAYPPYYFPPPGYLAAGVLATGLAFGAGYALGRWASGGNYWGGGMSWSSNNVNINRPTNINNIGNNWQHRPEHRHGVRYNNPAVQQKFGGTAASGSAARSDFRGHSGKQGLQPKAGQQPKGGMGPQAKGGMGASRQRADMAPQGAGGMGPQKAAWAWARKGAGGMGLRGDGRYGSGAFCASCRGQGVPRSGMSAQAERQVVTRARGHASFGEAPADVAAVDAVADAIRHRAQARHHAAWTSRQRPWFLSLRIPRHRNTICRCHGAGGATRYAGSRRARSRRLSQGLLRQAWPDSKHMINGSPRALGPIRCVWNHH